MSQGDDELLARNGPVGRHFPPLPDGFSAGRCPADNNEAVELVDYVKREGGQFRPFGAWRQCPLDHYRAERQPLSRNDGVPRTADGIGVIYKLGRTT